LVVEINLTGKTVLITGGTKGIGYAAARRFAMAGAGLFMTYKWGSAEEDLIYEDFEKIGAPKPILLSADVSVDEDTDAVMEEIGLHTDSLDILVSNVGFAARTLELADYAKRSLFKTLEYSSWPIVAYTRAIKESFGSYPGHVIGISSDGPDHYYRGYDFVAASKALLEFFGKYLAVHLQKEGSRVNIIRFGTVKTESFSQIFGEKFFDFLKQEGIDESLILSPDDCGKAVLALTSGLMDGMNGQVVTVDNGLGFRDNTMNRYMATLEETSS
jgi:NAD(P)-dependent dehydrogenase (short-subunit alcohol dehydrogenase family)